MHIDPKDILIINARHLRDQFDFKINDSSNLTKSLQFRSALKSKVSILNHLSKLYDIFYIGTYYYTINNKIVPEGGKTMREFLSLMWIVDNPSPHSIYLLDNNHHYYYLE